MYLIRYMFMILKGVMKLQTSFTFMKYAEEELEVKKLQIRYVNCTDNTAAN